MGYYRENLYQSFHLLVKHPDILVHDNCYTLEKSVADIFDNRTESRNVWKMNRNHI